VTGRSTPTPSSASRAARPAPLVKICGITNRSDALFADSLGADYVGVILSNGFGRSVPPDRAGSIVVDLRAPTVAVLVDEQPSEAAARAHQIGASVIQLHGSEGRDTVSAIRDLGEWMLWKAVRARSVDDVRRAIDVLGDLVDGVLVEGWRRGVTGGGGVRVEMDAHELRHSVPKHLTFGLAGGLNAGNVAEAVARFSPDVVDVSSGIERELGVKDHELVRAFIEAARAESIPSEPSALNARPS